MHVICKNILYMYKIFKILYVPQRKCTRGMKARDILCMFLFYAICCIYNLYMCLLILINKENNACFILKSTSKKISFTRM